jgi:hypothetical protein
VLVSPIDCRDPDFQCYIDQAVKGITIVRQNISYWSNVYLIAQIFVVLSGIIATVMIALQGDENRHWTRPIGLVATALVTGLTSALVSFHVPENIDKLVDIVSNMTNITNSFDYETEKLAAGKTREQVEDAFKSDPKFRESVNDLSKKFVDDYNKVKIDMIRLSGTAAKLNSIAPPATNDTQRPQK